MYNALIKCKRCLWDAKPWPKKDNVREQETLSKREELKALACLLCLHPIVPFELQ